MENVITNPALQAEMKKAAEETIATQEKSERMQDESPAALAEQAAPKGEEAIVELAKERLETRRKLILRGLDIALLGTMLLVIAGMDEMGGRMVLALCYGVFVGTRYLYEVQRFRNVYRKPNEKKLQAEIKRLQEALGK